MSIQWQFSDSFLFSIQRNKKYFPKQKNNVFTYFMKVNFYICIYHNLLLPQNEMKINFLGILNIDVPIIDIVTDKD